MMQLGRTLHVTSRKQWRAWLARNHDKEKDIWLVYHRKSSGKPRIPYNDAVEEALCHGWIDSTVKRIDGEKFAQRFSRRKPTSALSEMNKERVRRLVRAKKMKRGGLEAIARVFDVSKDERFTIAPDILEPLGADRQAWKNFKKFPEGYKRVRIGFIESRRRHGTEMFQKSLAHFIGMTARNKKFGLVR